VTAGPGLPLRGALDLHAHRSPEFTTAVPGRLPNTEWARLAARAEATV
jgi:hypothetical protein